MSAQIERDIRAGRIEMSPWHSPEVNRIIQLQLEQDALRRYMIPAHLMIYPERQPPQARTEMKTWVQTLRSDLHTNNSRIDELSKSDTLGPIAKADAELMATEMHLRKALGEVLAQRLRTEAARSAERGC